MPSISCTIGAMAPDGDLGITDGLASTGGVSSMTDGGPELWQE
jgi:hypothetical protein